MRIAARVLRSLRCDDRPCPVSNRGPIAPETNCLLVLQQPDSVVEGDAPALRTRVRFKPALPDESRSSRQPESPRARFSATLRRPKSRVNSSGGPHSSAMWVASATPNLLCTPNSESPTEDQLSHPHCGRTTTHETPQALQRPKSFPELEFNEKNENKGTRVNSREFPTIYTN